MENYRDTVRSILETAAPYEDINDNTELVSSGILDSLTIVYLVTQLEEKYQVVIDEKLITPDNFENVYKIIELIDFVIKEKA